MAVTKGEVTLPEHQGSEGLWQVVGARAMKETQ